jgi:lipopolysaccharide transport system ATP-binding protein
MRVRLAFAVAAYLEPEILIVDEVLAVGDADFQKKAIGKMQDVAQGGERTVLFVSHNMASVAAICNKGLLLSNGKVNKIGNINEIIEKYLLVNNDASSSSYNNNEAENRRDVWISNAKVLCNDNEQSLVISGNTIKIIINYISKVRGLKCSLNIGIYDSYGDKLIHLGTTYGSANGFFVTELSGKIECSIPKFPLPEGRYTVNLSLSLNNQPYHSIKNALSFQVEGGDFFGNGKIPSIKESKFLVAHEWLIY